jgi:hypothetical protein
MEVQKRKEEVDREFFKRKVFMMIKKDILNDIKDEMVDEAFKRYHIRVRR